MKKDRANVRPIQYQPYHGRWTKVYFKDWGTHRSIEVCDGMDQTILTPEDVKALHDYCKKLGWIR